MLFSFSSFSRPASLAAGIAFLSSSELELILIEPTSRWIVDRSVQIVQDIYDDHGWHQSKVDLANQLPFLDCKLVWGVPAKAFGHLPSCSKGDLHFVNALHLEVLRSLNAVGCFFDHYSE